MPERSSTSWDEIALAFVVFVTTSIRYLRVAPPARLFGAFRSLPFRCPGPPRRVSFRQVQARSERSCWQAASHFGRTAFGG